jgi:hypothetical protein
MPSCSSGLGLWGFSLLAPFCLVVSTTFSCKNIYIYDAFIHFHYATYVTN